MRAGITLVEMLIVVALVGLLVGISFPAVSSGLDSLRLTAASDSLVSFFNAALNRAERRQQVVELTISKKDKRLLLRSVEAAFSSTLELPEGVSVVAVYPEPPQGEEGPRRFLLFPGGTAPRVAVELANRRGARRIVSIDPITGVPRVERVEAR